jgi:multiple sugar transport system ATP-binding protein
MGRAIVREPAAFLMDEPLSNLDAKLRVAMRAEIARLQSDLGVTTIYVTHDQVEAMTMGDRVAVMRRGVLQQVAPPQELYDRPVNVFVGGFIGSPSMNLLQGRLEDGNGALTLRLGEQALALDRELLDERPALRAWVGRELIAGIRPEELYDAALAGDAPADRRLRMRVQLREALGSEVIVHARIAARPAETEQVEELAEDLGVRTLDGAAGDGAAAETTIVGRLSPHSTVREGEMAEVVVDTRQLHFFDPETGLGIYDETPTGGAQP